MEPNEIALTIWDYSNETSVSNSSDLLISGVTVEDLSFCLRRF